ncbi:MAG: YidC/Oxa1 family membrane protein insertase [Candidatus Pacebacteria bacterium]|nr:YidC/Oxa1 family membrane protein insertase [Candidatus Paceibacterota bacterium]
MIISDLFRILLWQPLFNLLILFYSILPGHDFGIAIIALTILVRVILWPWQKKAIYSQIVLQKIQPKLKEIQKKYKNNKEKLGEELLKLTKSQKVNPFFGTFVTLVQLPILIALYRVFGGGLNEENFVYLYSFIRRPANLDPSFLGIVDLSQPNTILAVILGILLFFQQKFLIQAPKPKKGFANLFQTQMLYFMPIFTVLIFLRVPSALALYLIISTLFGVLQQKIVKKEIEEDEKRGNETTD